MITVANVKTQPIGDATSGAVSVYIGRAMPRRPGSVLGNPFKLQRGESREACLLKYRRWLRDLPSDSPQWQEIARLVEIARHEDLVLMCWCAPEKCHGDHLKEVIEEGLKRPQISKITATDGPVISITIPATDGPVMLSSVWEVPDAEALDLMTTDRNFWRSTFEDCAADGFSAAERVIAERIVAISEECDVLRERLTWSERERGRCQDATNAMGRVMRDFLGGDDYKDGELMRPDAATMEAEVKELDARIAALREKAHLFDVLVDHMASGAWSTFTEGEARVVLYKNKTGERVHGATLAEAVKAAMESEER